jgi:predicted HTH domain antitoxin
LYYRNKEAGVSKMSTVKLELDIPETLAKYLNVNDPDYKKRILELMAYQLIKDDKVSFGKAAEILGTDKTTLIIRLGEMGIPYYDCEISEVKEDAKEASFVYEKKKS